MFLTIALIATAAWIVLCGVFLGLVPDAKEREARALAEQLENQSLTAGKSTRASSERPVAVPIDLLVYRIERQIRLDEAAAHNYIDEPSVRSLHARTASAASN